MYPQEPDTNLYSKISRYAPSEGRTQLENFLTESLCDLLERITWFDRAGIERLVREALLGNSGDQTFLNSLSSAKDLSWQTQVYCSTENGCGFVDICLFDGDRIILAVENKIGAGFTTRVITQQDGEQSKIIEQLPLYDEWLAARCPGAALVLLTHKTQPPDGFCKEPGQELSTSEMSSRYRCTIRRTCRWTALYKWLSSWVSNFANASDEADDKLALGLTREFLEYLEEMSMSPIEINADDLHLMATLFEHDVWKKVRQLSSSARSMAERILPGIWGQPNKVPEIGAWEATQIFWDWAYCYERELMWYVGWGFSGRNGLRNIGIRLPSEIQPFVLVTSEKAEIPVAASEYDGLKSQGWEIHQSARQRIRFLKTTSIEKLQDAQGNLSEAYQTWLISSLEEAAHIVNLGHRNKSHSDNLR